MINGERQVQNPLQTAATAGLTRATHPKSPDPSKHLDPHHGFSLDATPFLSSCRAILLTINQ